MRAIRFNAPFVMTLLVLCLAIPAVAAEKHTVQMKNKAYAPATLTIAAGDSVTWTNNDDRDHTVIGANDAFKSGNIKPGGTWSHTFTQAGTYEYSCTYYPRMKGKIIVK